MAQINHTVFIQRITVLFKIDSVSKFFTCLRNITPLLCKMIMSIMSLEYVELKLNI